MYLDMHGLFKFWSHLWDGEEYGLRGWRLQGSKNSTFSEHRYFAYQTECYEQQQKRGVTKMFGLWCFCGLWGYLVVSLTALLFLITVWPYFLLIRYITFKEPLPLNYDKKNSHFIHPCS